MANVKKAQTGLKAPAKRVGPIDPFGAYTTVQKQTLAGKRTPVSLTKDKELGATKMAKKGGKIMMKRADGSVSQRGLWDNIRAAKGSGKKPTSAMLKQEKKIKSKKK